MPANSSPISPVQVLLATVRRDPQNGRLFAEGAPERARLAAQVPAGLVDVERRRCTGPLEQLVVDRRQRLGGAGEDRVDRPDCDRAAKQLLHQLNDLSTRKTVANRQGCDRRLQLRPKQARRTPAGSSARTVRPQLGQQTRCKRCSLISTANGGSSATWCRAGAPRGSPSSSRKT